MIYLDNAATSYPKPKQVARAMKWALEQCGNPGRGGHDLSLRAGQVVLGCRQALSDLFHVADPFRIVFCYNCTDALNLALNGMIRHGVTWWRPSGAQLGAGPCSRGSAGHHRGR